MKKLILILILCFASPLFGDVTYSHFYPNVPKTLNIGSDANEWNLLEVNDVNVHNNLFVWNRVGIGTASPDSAFHIKANVAGSVGSHSAGQIIIQNPTDSVFSNDPHENSRPG